MRILIAPLNWGLGHATRCVPLIERYRRTGHEIILGGDGESLLYLKRRYPTLRVVQLAPLNVHYSASRHQIPTLLRLLPSFIRFVREDRRRLGELQAQYHFDLVISDNRFGLYHPQPMCVYLTHQLQIRLPLLWRWAESLATRLHAFYYMRFDEIWVPDYADPSHNLSGYLGHPNPSNTELLLQIKLKYKGPLSRFSLPESQAAESPSEPYDVVAVLSGPEPQRSLLEAEIIRRYEHTDKRVLIVRGRMQGPLTRASHRHITLVPRMEDKELATALRSCQHIIARSGYSTIMDLEALGLLADSKVELIPTPGQSEQEYLSTLR